MALGLGFAPSLKTEALVLRAPPSRCNAESVAAPWSKALPALWADRVIAGASHCDFESPSDWMCAIACGAPDAARQALVRAALVEAMDRWLSPVPRQCGAPFCSVLIERIAQALAALGQRGEAVPR